LEKGGDKMDKKLIIAVLVPLMIMIVAAYGYASFTSQIGENITATAGNLTVNFINSGAWSITGPPYVIVSFTGTTSTLLVAKVSNFAPGDVVTINFEVQNTGSLPITSISSNYGTGVWLGNFLYTDNVAGSLTIGQTWWFTATITAGPSLGQGESQTFGITITASD
jgi:hypothetical protein